MHTPIKKLHENFVAMVFGDDPLPPDQAEEIRRAFYAGGAATFYMQLHEIAKMDYVEAEAALTALEEEFKKFFTDLKKQGDASNN
jgi:hypothetical protein